MKNTMLCLLLLLFSTQTIWSQAVQKSAHLERNIQNGTEKVHVMSYNILNGFDGLKDTERKDRFVQWIIEQDPEVLALQELVGIDAKELQAIAKAYGHPYAVILKENGYPVGLTSKKPIELKNRVTTDYWHGMLHCKTYGIDFVVVHLSPADWRYRLREAKQITKYMEQNKLDRCMVMGDFNAHSPLDAGWLEQQSDLMLKVAVGDAKSEKYKNMNNAQFDYGTISTFLSYPLIDVCHKYVSPAERGTFPSRVLAHWSKNDYRFSKLQERIDFILVTESLQKDCVDAQIYNKADTDYLSDHYPIGIDIMLPSNK